MASTTSKLGLRKDDPTDLYNVAVVNSNLDLLEESIGKAVVTSGTRPVDPYVDQAIWESDTGKNYVWDGGTWQQTDYTPTSSTTGVVNLTDASPIVTDVSAGRTFRVTISGDRTLDSPDNPTDGLICEWEVKANGGDYTLTLATGAGGFKFGTSVTVLTAIADGTTDMIRAKYNEPSDRWRVIDVAKGF